MHIVNTVLFDMDGVLINSNAAIEDFWRQWAIKENLAFNEAVINRFIHGRPTQETIQSLFAASAEHTKKEIAEQARQFDNHMRPPLINGVDKLLHSLHRLQVNIGLVTSAPAERVGYMLKPHAVYDLFAAMTTSEDCAKGKPDPAPYLHMATRLHVSPGECVVFEDSDAGITAARAAGMQVIAVNNHTTTEKLLGSIGDFTCLTVTDNCLYNQLDAVAYLSFSC